MAPAGFLIQMCSILAPIRVVAFSTPLFRRRAVCCRSIISLSRRRIPRQIALWVLDDPLNASEVVDTLCDDVAVFAENGTQCMHQIGALMDEALASSEQHCHGLLLRNCSLGTGSPGKTRNR
ncbi:hypothetical protein MAXJ12_24262 [Mesorhizobium alhagi CCNWXJ12-2]|uniref:Uncharacterized protein n=1 Tax=Mesorhizobium alhagi CCNWXJ12-2 TaxID=1107882 RepID=H0HXD3_9HYPH|nr:hypothetical protein MAXJ12_24262 [Mesorhizobium alhagi CCNWXJ12-2]